MNNIFRALIAGYGAKKLGGGCISTILVFILIWVLLGQCNAALPSDLGDAGAKIEHVESVPARQAYAAAPLTASPIAFGMAES